MRFSYFRQTLPSLVFLDTFGPLLVGQLIYSVHEILGTPQLERVRPEYQLLDSLLAGIKESFEQVESQLDSGQASVES
jgi:hypothetical protein